MTMPQPRETPTNAPMLETWRREGALELQRCTACGKTVFYPRSICPHCHGHDLVWYRASGRGRIVSFSRIHRGLPEAFQAQAPIVLAEIALAEGAAMIARVVTDEPDKVTSGTAVELVPADQAGTFALPTFRPA